MSLILVDVGVALLICSFVWFIFFLGLGNLCRLFISGLLAVSSQYFIVAHSFYKYQNQFLLVFKFLISGFQFV